MSLYGLLLMGATGCMQKRGPYTPPDETPTSPTTPTTPDPTTPTTTPPPDYNACSSTLIDKGQKGSVAGVARGQYSDTKMLPNSASPVTAFADQSAVSIKLVFWNGTKWVTEIISGDGNATALRLVITSTGVPIVSWLVGVNVKVAVRSLPVPQGPAMWNAGVIDTSTAPRALEASVNPADQILLSFITDNTGSTGRAKIIYCDAPCLGPSSFQTMAPATPYIENVASAANQTGMGAGWCNAGSGVYYPVVTYSNAAAVRYAICQNGLSTCVASNKWTPVNVAATVSVSTRVMLDSNVTSDVPRVMALGTTGLVPYRMGTVLCSAVPTTFTAGAVLGTATTGSQWFSVLKDGVNKYHVIANDSTTSLRYFNSTSTDFIASWNAAGIAETTTLPAAAQGGAGLDSVNGSIYASFSSAIAAYDLRIAKVNNYAVSSATASFTRYTPDLTGNMQLGTAGTQHKLSSTALAPLANTPGVAYVDYSAGTATSGKLKYAYRTGTHASDPWVSVLVPGPAAPQFPSLAYDGYDQPWIAYFDATLSRFFLVTNSRVDGSGNWTSFEFPATPSGALTALPAASNTALLMYPTTVGGATVLNPLMIVIDNFATTKGVKAALFNVTSQSFGAAVSIDPLTSGALGAAHLAADIDKNSVIAIAFQDLSVGKVKYSVSTNLSTWSTPLTLSAVGQGVGVSLKINPNDGKPGISYIDQTNNSVYYTACISSAANCATTGWTSTKIEAAEGISGLTAATGQLLVTAVDFNPTTHRPYVIYPRGQANDGALVQSDFTGTSWNARVVASGLNANLPGTAALNFGVTGWSLSAAHNGVGGVASVFVGPGNWLYTMSCGD